MGDPGKLRRRDRGAAPTEWTRPEEAAPGAPPAAPAEAEVDPIHGLLGAPPVPPEGLRRVWQRARFALVPLLVLGLAAPLFFWVRYQSNHVTSKNASVRGHVAEIGTRLTGLVKSVEVDVGDRVRAGQVIVRLEDRHLVAEVQEARAEVEALQRTIDMEQLNVLHQRRRVGQAAEEAAAKVAAAQAQAEEARIRAEEARRDHANRQTLYQRDGVVSGEDVRNAETRRLTAEARLDEARANSDAAKSAGRTVRLEADLIAIEEGKVGVLEAELLRARARLARAEADLDGTSIRAPEDGAIVRRVVQPGGSVEAGQPILAMWLGRDVWVEAWVDEDDIGKVRVGSVATVSFHSLPGREFAGVVDKIGLSTDFEIPDAQVPQPRFSRMRSAPVVGVRIRLHEPPPELVPGLSAVVAIRKAE